MATLQPSLTECPVCSEHYKIPKLLPCAHRLCRHCLVQWLQKHPGTGHPTCPLCRRYITTATAQESADSVADQLPSDDTMAALVQCTEALEGPNKCAGCGTSGASDFCLQCWEKYCPSCSKLHTNMAMARHHTVRALSAVTPQDLMASRRRMCPTHPSKEADTFCASHQAAICVTCSATSHRKCENIVEVRQEGARKRQALKDKHTELQKMADTYKKSQRALKRRKGRVDVWREGERQRVNAVHQRLVKALDAGRDKVLDDLDRAARRKHQDIQARLDKLSEQLADLGNQMKLLEEEETWAADCDLVTMTTSLLDRVASLKLDDDVTGSERREDYCVALFDQDYVSQLEKQLSQLGTMGTMSCRELLDKAYSQASPCRLLVLRPALHADINRDPDAGGPFQSSPPLRLVVENPVFEVTQGYSSKMVTMSVCRPGLAGTQTVRTNMQKALAYLAPGPHAVNWIVPVLPDSQDPAVRTQLEAAIVECFQEAKSLLQPFPAHKLVVVFQTSVEDFELEVEEYLPRACAGMRGLVQEAGGRWVVRKDDKVEGAEEEWGVALAAQLGL